MKRFTSFLAAALIAASLFLSSPFPMSGDDSLAKIIHLQKNGTDNPKPHGYPGSLHSAGHPHRLL